MEETARKTIKIDRELTREQIAALERLGITLRWKYVVDCHLCVEFEGETKEETSIAEWKKDWSKVIQMASNILGKKLVEHIENQCPVSKFLEQFKEGVKMKDVGRFLQLQEKIMSAKAGKDEVEEFLRLANDIKKAK